MLNLSHTLQLVSAIGLTIVTLSALRNWVESRVLSGAYLTAGMGLLVLTTVLGQVLPYTQGLLTNILFYISLLSFLFSGLAFLLFRDNLIPLGGQIKNAVFVIFLVLGLLCVLVQLPSQTGAIHTAPQYVVVLAFIAAWCGCVGEPSLRLWVLSRHQPAVIRARMRALCAGYGAIVCVLIGSVAANGIHNSNEQNSSLGKVLLQGLVLLILPILYAGFSPPRWLRRIWREREEENAQSSVNALLYYAPDRITLAERGIEWVPRLVGGSAAIISLGTPPTLITKEMEKEKALSLVEETEGKAGLIQSNIMSNKKVIVVPLPLKVDVGSVICLPGPFTPLFGADEVARLHTYASSLAMALDRVRLTEELQEKERQLEAASKTRSEFMNMAAHELRTPLSVVTGYLSLIHEGDFGTISTEQQKPLDVIYRESKHLTRLVDELLVAVRLEANSVPIHLEQNSLASAVTKAVASIMDRATFVGATISFEEPPLSPVVLADPLHLDRILMNLINNALNYSDGAPQITIEVGQEEMPYVRVKDKGIGIAPEFHEKVFERFYRIQDNFRTSRTGTGLGLAICQQLAESQGGKLVLEESVLGEGSTFVLYLPGAPHEDSMTEEAKGPELSVKASGISPP